MVKRLRCRNLQFRVYIANDQILARKDYANEKDIRPPDEFLSPKDVKASTDYGWNHDLVSHQSEDFGAIKDRHL